MKDKENKARMGREAAAHILAIPFPLQGHINPMLQLCHRLSSKRLRVTVITTSSIAKTLNNHIINLETVPDSPPPPADESPDVYDNFIRGFRAAVTAGLPDIIHKHNNSLRAILYGSVTPWILDIAHQHGLKGAILFTQPCTVNAVYYHMHKGTLGISPDGDEDQEVSLPGMPAVMRVKDLPSLVHDDEGCYSAILKAMLEQFSDLDKADWRLFNTFDKLENEILKWMGSIYPIQTIGPSIPSMYTDKRIPENYDYGLSFFKPETQECEKWLDERPSQSVIYVSFGSLANLSTKQMEEVAWGLLDSGCNFLWVVRDAEQSKLPPQKYFTRVGLIVNWCVQLQVLAHPAVGCFFTHCGWNSTLEALSLGVPMVVMPQWTDQTTNAKLVADVWRTGVRVKSDGDDGVVGRENVAACIKEVMQGQAIRENASKWKDVAVEAVTQGGSSDVNITQFATQLLAL